MSDKYATAVLVPEISKDGKSIRLVLLDPDGKPLLPLIVSTSGMARIVDLLSNAVKTAEATQQINASENVEGFKPTPQVYRAKELDFVLHTPTKTATLVLQTLESTELHLVFRQPLLRSMVDLAQQVEAVLDLDDASVH